MKPTETDPWSLLKDFEWMVNQNKSYPKWIVNLDLDYFSVKTDDGHVQFVSDVFIDELIKSMKIGLDQNRIDVLTIAMSPDCCGGWQQSKELLKKLTRTLGLQITLP